LSDVIALISLLSVDERTFRSTSRLKDALRGNPISVKSQRWEDVASAHPEFFRFNGDKTSVALLLRSYLQEDESKQRRVLEVSEAQKLIDTAIALHDKEIQRSQRNSYLLPFIGSLIIALIAAGTTIFNTANINNNSSKIIQKIDSLNIKIRVLELDSIKVKNQSSMEK